MTGDQNGSDGDRGIARSKKGVAVEGERAVRLKLVDPLSTINPGPSPVDDHCLGNADASEWAERHERSEKLAAADGLFWEARDPVNSVSKGQKGRVRLAEDRGMHLYG
jgi:hypothetical protein